ncbi:MAG TPA: hypothetical protein VHT51_18965 [Micropepsaceae bacterium]|nr:hypothetical protein [Micropepsaceae bacterium]
MMKIRTFLPVLLVAAAFVSPAAANWFHNPYEGINRNIGSAPNPTPQDIRDNRLPIAAKNEQADPAATAKDANSDANKTTSVPVQAKSPDTNSGVVASASPSR